NLVTNKKGYIEVNENYEMSVAITVSHIFVNGRELGLFYKKVQENFNQPI
ncbi:MAG: hypothetical protein Q4Q48_05595, partial [Methanobrevibacter smithii]|nr:hypothetical protein [Methanobrevibacter smithii]